MCVFGAGKDYPGDYCKILRAIRGKIERVASK